MVCGDNSKVVRWCVSVVVSKVVRVVVDRLKGWLVGLWIECGWLGNEKTIARALPS